MDDFLAFFYHTKQFFFRARFFIIFFINQIDRLLIYNAKLANVSIALHSFHRQSNSLLL